MEVLCENYNKNNKHCENCYHATPHEFKFTECHCNYGFCGDCSNKPLRKLKLKKLNGLDEDRLPINTNTLNLYS